MLQPPLEINRVRPGLSPGDVVAAAFLTRNGPRPRIRPAGGNPVFSDSEGVCRALPQVRRDGRIAPIAPERHAPSGGSGAAGRKTRWRVSSSNNRPRASSRIFGEGGAVLENVRNQKKRPTGRTPMVSDAEGARRATPQGRRRDGRIVPIAPGRRAPSGGSGAADRMPRWRASRKTTAPFFTNAWWRWVVLDDVRSRHACLHPLVGGNPRARRGPRA